MVNPLRRFVGQVEILDFSFFSCHLVSDLVFSLHLWSNFLDIDTSAVVFQSSYSSSTTVFEGLVVLLGVLSLSSIILVNLSVLIVSKLSLIYFFIWVWNGRSLKPHTNLSITAIILWYSLKWFYVFYCCRLKFDVFFVWFSDKIIDQFYWFDEFMTLCF